MYARGFNPLCQALFYFADKRFHRKLSLSRLCRHHQKASQVFRLQVIVVSNDQNATDDFLRDSARLGSLNGRPEGILTSDVTRRQSQSQKQPAEKKDLPTNHPIFLFLYHYRSQP